MPKKLIIPIIVSLCLLIPGFSQVLYKNQGQSQSVGRVNKGRLINAYKLPKSQGNFKYFSWFDYYVLGRCYIHSDIHKIILNSYMELEEFYPGYTFRIMETSKKKGGKLFPHITHQNGTSADFMTPLKKGKHEQLIYDRFGMLRYALTFNARGEFRLNKHVKIDFDKMAKHILLLNKAARKNGYKIKKVILETNLKDEIYSCKYGSELKSSGIYFVRNLSPRVNKLHDDHYHIDFEKI